MRPTLFAFAGGQPAFLALATAHHARCLADRELNHPFARDDLDPHHVARLAAYWAEVMGGPPRYSRELRGQSALLRMHAGNGDISDLGRRFVACFVAALDDARLPADPEFRAAVVGYLEWGTRLALSNSQPGAQVVRSAPVPRWGWGVAPPWTG